MKIITFGNCCKKSKQNHLNACTAAKNCGLIEEVENVESFEEMMKLGIMSTPAIVINGKTVGVGRSLSVKEIEKLIKERQ